MSFAIPHEPIIQAAEAVMILFLTVSAATDFFYQKIFNKSIILFLALGIFLVVKGDLKITGAIAGFITGGCILLPFFLLGAVGPGDVKFLATVGFLSGNWEYVIWGVLYGAIAGGIGAFFILLKRKKLKTTISRTAEIVKAFFISGGKMPPPAEDSLKLPYVFYLSIGFLVRLLEVKLLNPQ